MRQITEQSIRAFISQQKFNRDNTQVLLNEDGHRAELRLHGNLIAVKQLREGQTHYEVNFCGWPTPTTKERLNGLTQALGYGRVFHTVKGVLCANGAPIPEDVWLSEKGGWTS